MELRRWLRVRSVLLLAASVQILAAVFGVSILLGPTATSAVTQTIPYKINFQGRLTDNNGNILSDGSYNIKFRIFDATSGGTNLWEADRVAGISDHRITVQNGLFNIQFGDTSQGDPALSPSLFSGTFPLYLEVELPTPATATCATNGCASFTEGAMTPRQALASSPYAFNSDTLDGLDSTAFGQLSAANAFTGANTFSDTNTFSKSGGAGVVLSGSAASAGSILQIGSVLSSGNTNGTLIGANTTSTGDLLNLQVSNTSEFKVDNSGNLTLASGAGVTIGSSAGSTVSACGAGQYLQSQAVTGGIVTGGSCTSILTGAGAANQQLSNLSGTVAVNLSLVPQTTNSINLGSSSVVYTSAFLRNVTFDGSAAGAINFTGSAATANALTITGQTATTGTNAGGAITVTAGTAASTGSGGLLTLDGGSTSAGGGTNGGVTIDAGTGATTANGTILIGNTNASTITLGNTTVATNLNLGNGSGANIIAIGNTQNTGSVSIGTALTTGSITIGSTAANTTVTTIQGGNTAAGSIVLTPQAAGGIVIGAAAGTGNITLGSTSGATQSVLIANGAGLVPAVSIANATTAGATVNIAGGANTVADTINIANGASGAASTVNILSGVGTAGASAINVADNTRVNAINIGNIAPAAARTTIIDGGNAAVVDTIDIGTGNATVAGGKTIHIGDGTPTGTNLITIGAIANTASTTTIQGGNVAAGAILLTPQAAGGIVIGAAAGTGNITLGSTSGATQSIFIANGAGLVPAVSIANASTAGVTVSVAGGANTVADTVSIANGATAAASTVNILSGVGTAGAAALNLADNTRVNTINLGNIAPAAARAINIGDTVGANGVVDTIDIGNGAPTVAGGNTINIGAGTPTGSGTNLVTIGSIAALANTTTIQGGNVSTGTGAVSIQAATNGLITLGTTNGNPITTGAGAVTLGGTTTVSSGKNLVVTSGAFNQTFSSAVAANAQTLAFTNSSAGAAVIVQGINITPANTTPSSGTNQLNLINFAAGSGTSGTAATTGINFASSTGYTNYITTPTTTLDTSGDLTSAFINLGQATTANGAGTNSTTLILTSATGFVTGNYVQMNSANCGGSGVNPCYAKITNIATNTLTITPALTWLTGSTVNQYHLPEIGGTDTAQPLAGRYGRGYFIAGVATGNGTTFYDEDGITSSLSTFNLLSSSTDAVTTLNIGNTSTANLNLGGSGTTISIPGSLSVTGNITAPSTGTAGYLSRSGTTLSPSNSGDNFTTTGNISTTGSGNISSAGTVTVGSFAAGSSTLVCSNAGTLSTCSGVPSTTTLQQAYGNGATISTSGNDIGFTLNSSQNFTVTTAAGATGSTTFALANGTNATPPAQLVLVTDQDTNDGVTDAVKVSSAGGTIANGFDASGTNITNALSIGANAIAGTHFSVTAAGAVTAVGINAGTGSIAGTGGIAITGASTIAGTLGSVTNLTLSGTISGGTTITGTTINGTVGIVSPALDNSGTLTVGTANATSIQIGKSGVAPSLPGGLTTSGGTISTGAGSITTTSSLNGGTAVLGTSVTSPSYTGTGAVSVTSGAASGLTLDSTNGTLVFGSNTTTLQKAATALSIDLTTAGTSTLTIKNSNGANVANLSVTGTISAPTINASTTLQVGGSQITSGALSDSASLAKLSALSQTFVGTNTFQPTTNISSAVIKQNSSGSFGQDIFDVNGSSSGNFIQVTSTAANQGAVTIQSLGANALTLQSGSGQVTLGSSTSLTTTGALTVESTGSNVLTLATQTSGANIALSPNGTGVVQVGGTTPTITTAAGTTSSGLTLGTGNASGGTAGGITIDTGTSTSGTPVIAIGNTNINHTIQVGTNATGNQVVNIGATGNTSDITTIQGGGATTGGILFNATTVSLSATNPTLTNATGNTLTIDTAGTQALNIGHANTNTLNIGNSTAATQVLIQGGTDAGGTGGSNAIALTAAANGDILATTTGTGITEIDSGAGFVSQSTTNNTQAFQIQNSGGISMLNIDTLTGAATNLLNNSGFEKNPITNWVGLAAGGSITRVTTQAFSDFASGQVVTSTTAGGGFDEPVTLSTNTQYTFSFYAKADASTPNISDLRAGYSSTGAAGGEVNCTLNSTTIITAGWNRYICTFTTPGTSSGTPYIYIGHTTTTSDDFYVDAAQLETGSFASPYGQGQLTLNATINSPVNFQETANSSTAFQITNTIGTNILNVDTFNNNQNNQAINPSFETGLTGWTNRTGCTLTQDNTTAYNGTSSALCTNAATAKAGFELLSSTGLSPALVANTTYTISLYAKSSANMTTLEIGHDDVSGTDIPCLTAQTATALGWKRFTCTFTTGATLTTPFVYVMQTDATARSLWIDAVTFETDANASSNYRDGRISLGNATISSPAVFQTLTNSTTAFQVQNAAGIQVFDIDTASDTNLVTNSGFEVNSVGWTAINGGSALIRDTSKSYVGIASGKVTTTTTANSGMRFTFSAQQPAVAATAYTISAYVETSVADSTFTLGYNNGTTDVACAPTPTPSATVPSTAGWTRFTCSTPVNTAVSSVFVSSGTTAVTLNVDGVQMVLGSTAPAFGNSNISFNGVFTSPIAVRNPNNTTTEFQVQDASSNTLYNIDSLNDTISEGATGTLALASTVNLATSTGATQTVNIGSTGAGTAAAGTLVNVQGGTTANTAISFGTNGAGGITLDTGTNGAGGTVGNINIGTGTTGNPTKTINIGPTATGTGTTAINVGVNVAGTQTIKVGSSSNGAAATGTTVDIQGGTTANTAVLIGTNGAGGITIDSGTSGTVNIGNNANAKTITIGNTTGATAVDLVTGSGGVVVMGTTPTITTSGATALKLDPGGAAALNLGPTNATSIVVGGNTAATITDKVANSSATAYTLQTAGGTNLLVASSSGSELFVGGSAGSGTPILLVFGDKNSTGDPTGVAGAEYYNSTNNVFRCAQGGTTFVDCIQPFNGNSAAQAVNAATAYLAGSNISVPGAGLKAGTQITWRLGLTKQAVGATAPTILVKYGTTGTAADTTEITFTLPTETAATDTGQVTIVMTVAAVNSSTGSFTGNLSMTRANITATGLIATANQQAFVSSVTPATFNDTVAGAIIGLACGANTDDLTFQTVQVNVSNL